MNTPRHLAGNPIDSRYVAKTLQSIPELLGGWLGRDANNKEIKDPEGNRCLQDQPWQVGHFVPDLHRQTGYHHPKGQTRCVCF